MLFRSPPSSLVFHSLQATALNEPIVILRNMLAHPQVKFNNELFHYDSFDKAHLGESVNVLYQAVDPCGWNIEGQYWMKHTFSHYVAHMKRVDHQIRAFRVRARAINFCDITSHHITSHRTTPRHATPYPFDTRLWLYAGRASHRAEMFE